jgi:hypothetical protein
MLRNFSSLDRLPNSRKSESEADYIGLRLMSWVVVPSKSERRH